MRTAQGIVSGLFAGRYAIERALGEGATATVFLARDTKAGISVAIKMLRPELAQSAASSRFVKEIKRMTALSHPRILSLIDSGEHEGQMYLVLPYMEGGTLRDRLKREKQLPIDEAIAIVQPIAEALDYAHAQGLIHRDVKPENILFTGGQPVLGDFGIARALETVLTETSTSTGIVRGTPAYMSPEQASGSMDYDGRSDIYALGCVLYEMLAGMPAFIGPTPEAVIAQRFAFPPREIRVYRPSVPPALEAVISKSLAIAPADRYRTAGEFAVELSNAQSSNLTGATWTGASPSTARPRVRTGHIIAGLTVVGIAALTWAIVGGAPSSAALDTTRVAVLPFENARSAVAPEDMLYEGLQRWKGLSIVESFATGDAVRQRGSLTTLADARAISTSLGAGRFVRGRMINAGTQQIAYAALYDVGAETELYRIRITIPDDPAAAVAAYAALADSLVLRGSSDGRPVGGPSRAASLPATQAFLLGRGALAEWDLAAAESLFRRSVDLDPESVRAHLWLAQVRSWIGQPEERWRTHAARAFEGVAHLSSDERQQATGLAALAQMDFPRACGVYRALSNDEPRGFIGWYGLGECHRLDRTVVNDPRSPSRWRFRSSYYRGMLAYQRAFELFPTSYRGFQQGAFEQLQLLLYAGGARLRSGYTADSSRQQFLAWPTAAGDTIAFIPYPSATMLAGGFQDPEGVAAALRRNRRIFHEIAGAWAAALPHNAGTKEAVAVSLSLIGDVQAARDSFRVARSLAEDSTLRLRLGVEEALAGVKLGLSRGRADMRMAMDLADSILSVDSPSNPVEAELLSRLAVAGGRCVRAADLVRRAAQPIPARASIPPTLLSRSYFEFPRIILGCAGAPVLRGLSEELQRIGASSDDRVVAEYLLVGALVAIGYPEYPDAVTRLARGTSDYVLVAQDSLLVGDTAATRRILRRTLDARSRQTVIDLSPDAALTEARMWLALGDTIIAQSVLDHSLASMRTSQPLSGNFVMRNVLRLGALGRVIAMRAELANVRGDTDTARRWASLGAELWRKADPELQPAVRAMERIAIP